MPQKNSLGPPRQISPLKKLACSTACLNKAMMLLAGFLMWMSLVEPLHALSPDEILLFQVDATKVGPPGSAGNPFLISSVIDLQELARAVNEGKSYGLTSGYRYSAAHYRLTETIMLEAPKRSRRTDEKLNFIPIGVASDQYQFTGNFNGAGNSIVGLYYEGNAAAIGLFGYISNAVISNLGLSRVSVTNRGKRTGTLVGIAQNSVLSNVATFSGTVKGNGENVGGLVGAAYNSHFADCYAKVAVVGNSRNVGGLIGISAAGAPEENASVSRCFAMGRVTGLGRNVGGLVGLNAAMQDGGDVLVQDSYAVVNVNGSERNVGGLIGANIGYVYGGHSRVIRTYAEGLVTSKSRYVGGLVGLENGNLLSVSYASGNVVGTDGVGGLVGRYVGRSLTASYAAGTVTADGNGVGGLIGSSTGGKISASYATGVVTGNQQVGGLIGILETSVLAASYATGDVIGNQHKGGLVGEIAGDSRIYSSYWNRDVWSHESRNGYGVSEETLRSPVDYRRLYKQWNVDINNDGIFDLPWNFGDTTEFPVLNYLPISVEEQRERMPRRIKRDRVEWVENIE